MPKRYTAMMAMRRPDQEDAETVFSFPEGKYGKNKLCSLFLLECKKRILAEPRQATDVQLDLYGENAGLVMRCVARFGGMDRLDLELASTHGVKPKGEMPSQMPRYRNTTSFGATGWDVIHHGDAYPSDPAHYEAMLDKFFQGKADEKNDRL